LLLRSSRIYILDGSTCIEGIEFFLQSRIRQDLGILDKFEFKILILQDFAWYVLVVTLGVPHSSSHSTQQARQLLIEALRMAPVSTYPWAFTIENYDASVGFLISVGSSEKSLKEL
jgi:hypothetical protein